MAQGLPSSLDAAYEEAESTTFTIPKEVEDQLKKQAQETAQRNKASEQALELSPIPQGMGGASAGTGKVPYLSAFTQAAQKYNVPINVLIGLAEQESRFKPTALGVQTEWGRAKGLMQYLDSTAAGMGINPYDPVQSIDAAARQLRQRLDKGYSMIDAAREHFAGPDRKKWGTKTHNYGIEVMQRAQKYQNIGAPAPSAQPAAQQQPKPSANPDPSRYRPLSADEIKRIDQAKKEGKSEIVLQVGMKPIKLGSNDDWDKRIAEQEAKKNIATDSGNLLMLGVNRLGESARELTHRIPITKPVAMLMDKIEEYFVGKTAEQIFAEANDHYTKKLSVPTAKARQKLWVVEPGDKLGDGTTSKGWNIGPAWKDPRAYYAGIVESVPELAVSMGGSLSLARGAFNTAIKSGATREAASKAAAKTATLAGSFIEGGLGGASSAVEVRKKINELPDNVIQQSDAIKELMNGGMTLAQAKKEVAERSATKAFVLAGVGTGVFGGLGDRAIAKIITEGSSSRIKSALSGAVAEGVFEEMPQSAASQVAQNYAVQDADPNQRLMQGVANQAAGGLAVGAAMGGGIGGATHRGPQEQKAEQPEQAAPPERKIGAIERAVNDGQDLDAAISAEIEAVTGQDNIEQLINQPNATPTDEGTSTATAEQWLGAPGTEVQVSPKEDPSSVYTVRVEGYQNGEVFARDSDGAPIQFGQDDIVSATPINDTEIPASSTGLDQSEKKWFKPKFRETVYEDDSGLMIAREAEKTTGERDWNFNVYRNREDFKNEKHLGTAKSLEEAKALLQQAQAPELTDFGVTPAETKPATQADANLSSFEEITPQAAPDTPKAEPVEIESPEKTLAKMDEAELRARIKYLADQAKASGGWNKRLMEERRKVETQINKNQEQKIDDKPYFKWEGMSPAERMAAAEKAGINADTARDILSKAWGAIDKSITDKLTAKPAPKPKAAKAPEVKQLEAKKPEADYSDAIPEQKQAATQEAAPFRQLIIDAHFNNPPMKAQLIQQEIKTGRPRHDVMKDVQGIVADIKAGKITAPTAAPQATKIEGKDLGDGWSEFSKDSGTIGIPRADMPQIKAEHRGAMVNFMNARGINHKEDTVAADSLKPTQKEFSREKVKKASEREGGDRSILVSKDGHVLDGHHQWMAAREKGEDVKVIRLDAPIKDLVDAAHEFPSSTVDENAVVPTQAETQSDERGPLLGADGKPKWFMSEDKAQAHIEKKKLTGQYHVKKIDNRRFEIHPIAADTQDATDTSSDKKIDETGSVDADKWNDLDPAYRVRILQTIGYATAQGKAQTSAKNMASDIFGDLPSATQKRIKEYFDEQAELQNEADAFGENKTGYAGYIPSGYPDVRYYTKEGQWNISNEANSWIIGHSPTEYVRGKTLELAYDKYQGKYGNDVAAPPVAKTETAQPKKETSAVKATGTTVQAGDLIRGVNKHVYELVDIQYNDAGGVDNVTVRLVERRDGQKIEGSPNSKRSLAEFSRTFGNYDLTRPAQQPAPKSQPSDFIQVISVSDKKAPTAEQIVEKVAQPDDGFTKVETKYGETLAVRTADLNDANTANLQSYSVDGKQRLKNISRDSITAGKAEVKADQFADNKLFTADKVAAARARLKSKLGQLNSGIDPEVLVDGMTIAGAYIESGVRKFSDYAKAMVEDLGDGVKPYLLSFWEGARNYPGLDNKGMTSVEDSAKEHAALLKPEDTQTEAVGQIAEKPKSRTKKTGAKGDMVLTQDWGVSQIDGYGDGSRESGNDTKDAFLKETRNYLNAVADALRAFGFEPHMDRKGKAEKPVSVNESGMAGSGDVSLTMTNPDNGNNVYITIGDSALRGVVPMTESGIAIMYRVGQNGDRYATRATNTWAPVDLSANDLAALVNSRARPVTNTEENQNARTVQSENVPAGDQGGTQGNVTTGNRDSEPLAAGVAETSESTDRGEPVSNSTQGAGGSGTRGVQPGQSTPSTSRDSGTVRTGLSTADTLSEGDTVVFSRDYEYAVAGQEYTIAKKTGAKITLSRDGAQTSLDVRLLNLALAKNLEITVIPQSKTADPATAETSPKPEIDQPADFDLANEEIGKGGLTKKYKDNIASIRILKAMQAESRLATPEERKQIARYVGWGALKGVFDKDSKQWSKEYTELKELLTDAEYKAARASTLNAHYTSPTVVGGIFKALERVGFTSGRVLEPSVGTGNFFGLMPATMRKKSQLHGVELDPLTSKIAAALYPSAKIAQATGFQDYQVPSEYFDVAIGNPPFGSEPIVDSDRTPYSGSSIHNYFFAKSIDKLRPGGLLTMVVSHNFMDANSETTRKWISERANLVSAVRLPRTAFKENAGTDVVTDILVFQKKSDVEYRNGIGNDSWVKTGTQKLTDPKTGNEVEHRVSSYFLTNPNNVLGTPSAAGSMYRAAEYTVEPSGDLNSQLSDWASNLPANMYQPIERTHEPEGADVSVPDGVKVGSFFVGDNGSISVRGPDAMGNRTATEWTAPNAKAAERMKGMIGLRDSLREQMRLEKSPDTTTEQIEANRTELNRQYDDFNKQYGFLNDQTNRRLFLDDTESALLLALEFDYDKGVSKAVAAREEIDPRNPSAVKADIFNRRVMFPPADNIKVSNAKDALLASLNYKARLDLPYMASLYDKTEAEIIQELGDVVYNDPINGYVMADEYLSGDVKTKLAEAQEAVKDNPDFKRNVEALKKVIPVDKLPSEIHAALGASFIPAELFEQFAKEVTGADHRVAYVKATGQWVIDPRGQTNDSLNVGKWGIAKMPATAIFARTMAGQGVVVTETVRLGGGKTETRVLEKETEAAREKQSALKAEWQRWLWSDPDRADRVASIYNEKMNRIVVRKYDGDHMTFPGMSPAIQLLEHQKNAVWRALQSRQVLLDHTVGAGKTFEIVALFMEMRRLGVARKPFIAVPNHLTLQWRSEFSRLYPAANVLAATPEDFSKGNREKFFSKIVTGDWDAVIVGHSSLKRISLPPETEKAVLEEQINEIADAIDQMKRERGDRNIIRDMEGIRARLAARMAQRVQNLGERDKVVTFDELGVDAFAIDELHEFKNLFYNSTMERVPGMGNPAGSDKAFDLFVKLQWMFNTFGDKAPIAGATGTPVSNSLVEMFNMQRLLQYPTLKKDGLHVFDAWAKQFGSVESLYEVAPSGTGYRQSSRFAKFKNLPALMSQYQTFADTVTLDDLKAQEEAQGKAFPVPKVFGGRPQNIVAKRSPNVASFMGTPELDIQDGHVQFSFNVAAGDRFEVKKSEQGDHLNVMIVQEIDGAEVTQHLGTAKTEEDARLMLVEQALSPKIHVDPKSILGQFSNLKELNKKTKGKVNALSLTGQANKAGLDYRLVDPTAPDFAGSKINMAVDRMMTTYHKWSADKGTQLIFCDLSVPKSARSGLGSKERRVYVRDEKGGIVHKKGTLHTAEGFEDLPHLVIKEGKEFAIYDAATGLRIRGQLPSKAVVLEWTKQTLSDEAKRQRWIDARDDVGDLDQDAIDDYNNANEINTEETEAISLSDIAGSSGAAGFSVYDDIKTKLIAKGVPEREIAFIHDYSTPVAKDKLFKAVNSGAIRFLLGSTLKMGAGTNVQKRLVGLHHIDAPWRPSDLEQREGRIIRRGNTLYERDPSGFEIEIYRYATEQTYDTRRWQILEHKSRGIEQLRNYDGSVNEIDDIEGEAANAADMKAAASGDPLILEETQLRNDVRRLESLQAAHADSTQMLFRRARDNQRFADEIGPRALEEFHDLQATADKNPVKKDQFAGLTMNGRKIADREDAVKAIQKEMVRVFAGGSDASFTYRGIEFTLDNTLGYVELNSPTGRLDSFDPSKDSLPSAAGFLTRFANYIARIPAHIDDLNAKIAEAQRDAVELREQANSTFAQADELTAAREAHKRVQRRLIAKGPDIPAKQKTLLDKAMEAQKSALRDQGLGDAMDEFVGSRQNSRGQAISTGTTVTEVREALVNRFGEKTIAKLEKDGTLSIIDVLNEPGVEGFTAGGKVTLVADALTAKTIVPVFLHELGGHVGFQGVMKPQAQKNLMDQFNKLVAAKDPIALEAKRLAEREADAAAQQAEYLPYLVTVAARTQNKRPGVRNLIARIVSAVKAWAFDRLGMDLNLNARDVLALAERMVNAVSNTAVSNSEQRFSREDQTSSEAFKRWFGDSKVVDENGKPLVVYHGTVGNFDSFNPIRAIWASTTPELANEYAEFSAEYRSKEKGVGASVIPLYMKAEQIFEADNLPRYVRVKSFISEVAKQAKENGVDVNDEYVEQTISRLRILARQEESGPDYAKHDFWLNASSMFGVEGKQIVQDFMSDMKFDGIVSTELDHTTYGVFKPNQVKSAIGNSGAFDPNNPDIRFSRADNDLAPVSEQEYNSKLGQWWNEAKQLPADALTNSMRGWGLGLVPLRPMLKEIAKDIPAAQTYLRVKDKMDALRNEWHAKVDAVAQDWLKYRIKNREENRELMDIMHESTLEQVDPSMPFQSLMTPKEVISLKNPSMNANLRAELTAKMDLDAKREEAYDKLKIRYDDLSPEARSIFEKVRDAYSDMADAFDETLLNNMEKAINVRIRKAEREYKREMERIKDEGMEGTERDNAVADAERALKNAKTKIAWNRKARLTQLRQQFETQRLAGPYFPLARFGQLFVTVRDAKTGEIVSFSRFEKAQEQRRFADEMKQDKNHKVEVGALADAEATRKAVDPNFVADVEDILADLPNAEQIKDEVWQRYLESLPDMSIRKSRIHRKGRAGYISDAVRAFGHHLFHGSHQLARMTYSMDLEDALDQARDESRETKDPTRSGLVVNEMNKRHQFVMNPTGGQLATWASSFAFVWYLAGSPKAALMNLFQTPIMGIPILAAYDGQKVNSIVRAGNQLSRALVDFTQGKGYAMRSTRLTAEELDAMEKGYETGIIEKTQGHELAGVAENGVEYNAMRERVMKVISWGFHHTERLNREVTFLAAYRIARNKGVPHEQAISDAGDLTWKTHFDYSNTSRPRLMHSDTMKILLVFRNFQLNMLFRLFRDIHQTMHGDSKEARREALTQLAGITGMMMLNAGITGTWLFGIAMLMAGLFLGDDEDPEEELKKGMVNILGPNLAGLALYGVPGHVTGTALSESIGMPDLWFRSPDSEKEGEEAMNFWVSQLLGAVPAIATQMFRGVSYIKKGEEYRGIETMLPKMLKDPMKSYRYATEGAKNMKGDIVAEVRWPDVVKQATGFTPARISEQYKINNLNYNKQQLILKSRKQLMDDYYKATQADDEKAVDEVISKIEKHNEKNPDQPITAKGLIQSAKTRQKGSETAVGGMRYNNKLRERILEDQAPSIYK